MLFSVLSTVYSLPAANDPGAAIRAKRTCPAPLAPKASVDAGLASFAPSLGAPAGLSAPECQANPNGDHISAVKAGVRVPCDCPPAQGDFAKQFAIDHTGEIKTDGSDASKKRNIELAIITLQNSFCCPAGSVTLNAQLSGQAPLTPSGNAPPPAQPPKQEQPQKQEPPKNNGNTSARTDPGAAIRAKRTCPAPLAPKANVDAGLASFAPSLGAPAGLSAPECQANPNGDHISAVKAGVRVPCDCPPAQGDFAKQFAIDHTGEIKTDGSDASKKRNIELAIITLQNSFCCPAGSVTLNAQLSGQAPLTPSGNAPPPAQPPKQEQPQKQEPPKNNGNTSARTDPGAAIRAKRTCPAPLAPKANVDAGLASFAPSLGAPAGLSAPECQANPNGDHISAVKAGVRVPCDCPPAQGDFAKQFAIDHTGEIKTDGSDASKKRNIELAIITLQNSFCCPAGSVTLNAQLSGQAPLTPSGNAPPPAQPPKQEQPQKQEPPKNNGNTSARTDPGAAIRAKRTCPAPLAPKANVDAGLASFAPSLGAPAGLSAPECQANPNGDHISAVKAGVRVPCDCPPAQGDFAKQFAIDHTGEIKTDGSKQSRARNIELAIVTLQNSFCCPAASVTLNAQLTALRQ